MNTRHSPGLPPVALIAGPTASGKSALALALAERTGVTIINADASQIYRDLRVLSARPDEDEERRAPHRLFGYLDGAEATSAADWASIARAEIAAAHSEGTLPILVGGTGLYLRTLLDGIAPIPSIDPAVRAEVRALPTVDAYAALARLDAEAAARVRPGDTSRVARALEVLRSTGRPIAEWQRERTGGIGGSVRLAPVILLPPRDWLHARIDARFENMLGTGAVEEVEALLVRRLDPASPVMRAIGVREISRWLAGETDRSTMIGQTQAATRQYAKRQCTWFRHQPPAQWTRIVAQPDNDLSALVVIILQQIALTS